MIYDSDKDGVLTFVQVKNAVNVLGKQIEGKMEDRYTFNHLPTFRSGLDGKYQKILRGYKKSQFRIQ